MQPFARFPREIAMIIRRSLVLPILIFTLSFSRGADTFAGGTPESLILSLYSEHQPGQKKEIDSCNRDSISKYCDSRLTNLFIKDCDCKKKNREVCNLDWDPFYDSQDFDQVAPDPRIKNVGQNSFQVTLNNFGEKKLIFEVVKTEVGWRISNIKSPSMHWSLVDVLSGKPK
jgi:hypothetical protein